jgi:hypothetical protein
MHTFADGQVARPLHINQETHPYLPSHRTLYCLNGLIGQLTMERDQDRGPLHTMVHVGRILCCQANPAMARI